MKPRVLRTACLQFSASDQIAENLKKTEELLHKAIQKKARLAALPENFAWRGGSDGLAFAASQTPAIIQKFQTLAAKYRIAVLLGSVLESIRNSAKCYNTSIFISDRGKIAGSYRKIHLFGIGLKKVRTDESRSIEPGKKVVTASWSGIKTGLSICYDLRFPELYRELAKQGARLFFVPANFTHVTGEAHWEVLLRARAIENQTFVVAPGQIGTNTFTGIRSYGTSLIVDPWGTVLAKGSESRDEVIFGDLDFRKQTQLRKQFPVLEHQVLK
jgi:predicted amidohydrolase